MGRQPRGRQRGGVATPVEASSWWDTHDRAQRNAIALLIVASSICSAYLAAAAAILVTGLRLGHYGPWKGLETWQHRLGPFGLAALAILFLVAGGLTIALLAWLRFARHVLRRAGARAPRPGEGGHAQSCISEVALGVGVTQPRLAIVDDPAVNAFATGRPDSTQIILTSGALDLPADELDALCAHTVVWVSQRACILASAAAGVILDADWCTRMVWGVAVFICLSPIVGVSPQFAAIAVLAIAILVVVTRPLVMIANRAIVELLEQCAELADLETVRITNRPESLAKLMLDTVEHRAPVRSTWDLSHLWFDPETATSTTTAWIPRVRPIAGADSRRTRAALVDRIRVLVDMTEGNPHLRTRLERATRDLAKRS